MSLELTNIGNANATEITYDFFHAFVNDKFELQYIHKIPGSSGTVELIKPGETYIANFTTPVTTNVGLHPVYATFGYTSEESEVDPRDDVNNVPEILINATLKEYPFGQLLINQAYSQPIFNTTRHTQVISSMDFGMVLPPINKEGTTKPIYPTPEVEVTTEIIGLNNDTRKGDTIIIKTTITNIGDEPTNIIYNQWIPTSQLIPNSNLSEIVITKDGEPITNFSANFVNNPRFGYGIGQIYLTRIGQNTIGTPLGINETMVVEVQYEIKNSGEIFLPPVEIRYNSNFNMTKTRGTEIATSDSMGTTVTLTTKLLHDSFGTTFTINIEQPINPSTETNSWGSYSDSLIVVIQSIIGQNMSYIYVGIGLIVITGVAVIIYFKANGKKH